MADFALGGLLAMIHFGGLWCSLARGPARARALSRTLRMAATGGGLTVLAAQGPGALLAGSTGFLLVRGLALALALAPRRGGD